MTQIEQWIESGLYVFVVMSEVGYQSNEGARLTWPDAVKCGQYRMVNFNKEKAHGFVDYLTSIGLNPHFGIGEETPMLLTWAEVEQLVSKIVSEESASAE